MYEHDLSLVIDEDHPAYRWAKKQSDSVSALGHIGTHIDCYQHVPEKNDYQVETVVLDCSERMPLPAEIEGLDLSGKALVLFSGNLEKNGYGSPEYGAEKTILPSAVLDLILTKSPAFILIDSYGIGAHGEEHISFDKRCEAEKCFVIENVLLTASIVFSLTRLKIQFNRAFAATAIPCKLRASTAYL
ncbi:cyclase family protein [Desulfotalea psychrophila]|uniref:Cyclase n=1 Tax=Desulfotalea psychrophila (strain LSv54 / DSM 12343) TaxID=177439 RepID=Q6ALX3_DESPS|nr:cyclase family protein [Desulfotalea psychrophila]CAG36652.1 unknown protein [Desulfotalea psychrophila LSv54]